MALTSEERQRIYDEEKMRLEAQDTLKKEAEQEKKKADEEKTKKAGVGCISILAIILIFVVFFSDDSGSLSSDKGEGSETTQAPAQEAVTTETQKASNSEVSGLGIRRSIAMAAVQVCAPEYKFQENPKINGRENYGSNFNRDGVTLQFIGAEDNLYQATAVALLDTQDKEQVNRAFRVLGCFHGSTTPTEASKDWLKLELLDYLTESLWSDYTHTKTFGDRDYKLTSTVIGAVPSITITMTKSK